MKFEKIEDFVWENAKHYAMPEALATAISEKFGVVVSIRYRTDYPVSSRPIDRRHEKNTHGMEIYKRKKDGERGAFLDEINVKTADILSRTQS